MKSKNERDILTDLEKNQMKRIDELQDKIRLMEFDKSQDNATIRDLKYILRNKKKSINEVITEIEQIQRKGDYSKLNHIRNVLGIIARQGVENGE